MITPDSLEHVLLSEADDDWLSVGAADRCAMDFETDPQKRPVVLLTSIRHLVEARLVQLGAIDWTAEKESGGTRFRPWPGSADEQLRHLSTVYRPERQGDTDWWWDGVLNITDGGRTELHGLPELDPKFGDW